MNAENLPPHALFIQWGHCVLALLAGPLFLLGMLLLILMARW